MRKLMAFGDVLVALASIPSEFWMGRVSYILESRVNKEMSLISGKRSAEATEWIISSLLEALCTGNLCRKDRERILALLADYLVDAQWKPSGEHSIERMVCLIILLLIIDDNPPQR